MVAVSMDATPPDRPTTRRTRGRPALSDQVVAQTRARIVDAAKALFRDAGFGAVSMRRIAADAGVGTATIYEYFPSKIDILRHIWADIFEILLSRVQAAGEKERGHAAVCAMASAYTGYWLENPDHFRMVFLNEDRSERGEALFVESFNITHRLQPLLTALEEGQANGEIVEGDPALFLQVLIGGLNGIALNGITISELAWTEPQELVKLLTSLLRSQSSCRLGD